MNVLDLFSGIGGFAIGLQRAGFRTIGFCEIDPFCRDVLAARWPDVPCHDDVQTFEPIAADAICAGFPCQDASIGQTQWGKRVGIDGERTGLWREVKRLANGIRPNVIVLENVPGLLSAGFGRVLGDLAEIGYDAEWDCIQASAIGAPHGRDRVWLLAYPYEIGCVCSSFGYSPFRQLVRGVAKDTWASEPSEAVPVYQSQTFLRVSSESASCNDAYGSSIRMQSPPRPRTEPPMPSA